MSARLQPRLKAAPRLTGLQAIGKSKQSTQVRECRRSRAGTQRRYLGVRATVTAPAFEGATGP